MEREILEDDMKSLKVFLIVIVLSLLLVMPVMAAPSEAPVTAEVTPDYLAETLLGLVGVGLSLAFKYVPKLKGWFDNFKHQGLLMLSLVVVAGGVYLALACTPYAAEFGIELACGESSAFMLIKAIFIVAVGNQLTYLYSPNPSPKK